MDIITKYEEELKEDTKLNIMNIMDVQLRLPTIKHKWVARLIRHKIKIDKMHKNIRIAKDIIIDDNIKNATVKLSRPVLEKHAESVDTIIKMRETISESEYCVMYLDKIERIFSGMSFDIKNTIDMMKMEQL